MFSTNVNYPVGDSAFSKKTEWQEKFELESTFPEIIKKSESGIMLLDV